MRTIDILVECQVSVDDLAIAKRLISETITKLNVYNNQKNQRKDVHAIMVTTYPIYVAAIDKKAGKAFVIKVDVPNNESPESYLNYYLEDIEYVEWNGDYNSILNTIQVINDGVSCLGKILKCKRCGEYYYMSNSNIYWYEANKMNLPKRCKACRMKNRNRRFTYD